MGLLESNTLETFRQDGVAVLRGVVDEAWRARLAAAIDDNMASPGPHGKNHADDDAGAYFGDYVNWQRFPAFREVGDAGRLGEVAAELMGAQRVQLFHEHVLVKEAATGVPTPWHQDAPYYCVDAAKTVSLWIPLDEVPRETTLEFVAGSHKWGKSYRPQRFDGSALNADDGLEEIPDINGNKADYDILGWAVSPGDAIAFDYRTVHGAPANTGQSRERRAFSLRLLGDDVRFVRREGIVTSPPFPKVNLAHGVPLAGDAFPVLIGA